MAGPRARTLGERLASLDWRRAARDLDELGHTRLPGLLTAAECRALDALYTRDERFRSTVAMEPRRFGAGEYRYFAYPLPPLVAELRESLYPPLARIANRWLAALGSPVRYPAELGRFLARCHRQGQGRPTPLLLRYGPGGFNCMHQDVYGPLAFPLQVAFLLSRPEADFSGGEFVLLEQRPRQQSRAEALALRRGEAVVFPNQLRPARGARGVVRAQVRHGVSRVRSGQRTALGVIFHDAK